MSDWKWKEAPLMCGILAMCDRNQEWLLPWWWSRLQAVGNYAVAFVDLGMSEEGRSFCEKHGLLLPLDERPHVARREEVDPLSVQAWEKRYGQKLWEARPAWFTKPLALLQTPFQQTLYLDLDCEVIGPLDSLFQPQQTALTLAQEPYDDAKDLIHELPLGDRFYNSGVLLYRHGTPFISLWAKMSQEENHRFCGDDNILSFLIAREGESVEPLHPRFHVHPLRGVPLDAMILHWAGTWGKNLIREQGGLKESLLSVLPVLHLETRLWTFEEKR